MTTFSLLPAYSAVASPVLRRRLAIWLTAAMLSAGSIAGASAAWADAGSGATTEAPARVNVNTASAQTIADVLKGIGLKRAEAIVAYREANGQFRDAYELANVKGVGERTVELNEARILLAD